MKQVWQLQEAKNKLSEVIEEAISHGPQIITRRGVETAVVLSYDDYHKMLSEQQDLYTFFRESPLVGADLDLERDKSDMRDSLSL